MWKCLKHSKSTGAYPRPSSLCCYKHALMLKPSDNQFNSNLWPQHFSVILQQWRSEIAAPSSPPQCWGEAMLSKHRCLSGGCLLPKSLFFFVVELTHSPLLEQTTPALCLHREMDLAGAAEAGVVSVLIPRILFSCVLQRFCMVCSVGFFLILN